MGFTLRDLFFMYGDTVVYRIFIKSIGSPLVDAGSFRFSDLSRCSHVLDYPVVHHDLDKGVLTVVI